MIPLEQKLLFDVVHAFVKLNQREAMRDVACSRALAYLSNTLTDEQFDSLKAELPDQ